MGIADKWKQRKVIERSLEAVEDDLNACDTATPVTEKRRWGRKK